MELFGFITWKIRLMGCAGTTMRRSIKALNVADNAGTLHERSRKVVRNTLASEAS